MANDYTTNLSLAKPARHDGYWDDEINDNFDIIDAKLLDKSGDTMTGLLTLSGAPTADLHASTKKYVDDNAITTLDSLTDIAAITEAQGQVIYHDGSNWNALDPGADGEFLKTQGADANPVWAAAGGGWDGTEDLAITSGVKLTGGYLRIGDGGIVDACSTDGDLYVERNFEVDGAFIYGGTAFNMSRTSGGLFYWIIKEVADNSFTISVNFGLDQLSWNIKAALGRQLVLNSQNYQRDFDHPVQDNPTLFIHSDTDPNTNNTQWVSFTHDQTDAVITTGAGTLNLGSADGKVNFSTATRTASTVTHDAYVELEIGGVVYKFMLGS